jgi:prepilin-type processing-associated H-X9-DG protein
MGWAATILPQMEQSSMYNALNFIYGGWDAQNTTVSESQLSTLVCPSEDRPAPNWPGTRLSYYANLGGPSSIITWSGPIVAMKNDSRGNSGGLMNSNCASFGVASVNDGTSNTALFSERLVGLGSSWVSPVFPGSRLALRFLFNTSFTVNSDSGNQQEALKFVQTCNSLPSTTSANLASGQYIGFMWDVAACNTNEDNSGYNHTNTPNKLSCTAANTQHPFLGGYMDALTASSNHSGGVNVAFCDGSVRFVKDSVNIQTWWAIGTRNVGEVVSSDAY